MIITVCTRAQLAGALTLGASVGQHHPKQRFIIGLADDPAGLPFIESATLLTLADTGLSDAELAALSVRYTPAEFSAAVKPGFIRTAFERFPDEQSLLYLNPSALVYQPLRAVFDLLASHTILLNPHWLTPPNDTLEPDEKHLQNVGLYSGGFIGFGRHAETRRMLAWWETRCHAHAALDFCIGSCLDQLWLMHVPTLFDGVHILKDPGLQTALWNLPQRRLVQESGGWQVQSALGGTPLLTADFLGLSRPDEGLFQHQNRLKLAKRPDVRQLLNEYHAVALPGVPTLSSPPALPAYGERPEPIVRVGWRRSTHARLQQLSHWINTVPVRPLHR